MTPLEIIDAAIATNKERAAKAREALDKDEATWTLGTTARYGLHAIIERCETENVGFEVIWARIAGAPRATETPR